MNDHRRVRIALAALGASAVLVAVGVDLIGGGGLGGFGAAQMALAGLGLAAIVAAATWSNFPQIYRDTGAILFTVVLMVAGLNLVAQQLIRPPVQPDRHDPQTLSYFSEVEWGAEVWTHLNTILERRAYEPYTIWGGIPYESPLTNVSETGERLTTGAACGESAYRVFVFGGSTVWGYAVPDSSTIPSYLQQVLSAAMPDRDVCVVNQGQLAYTSTQSLIRFLGLIQEGDAPDMAVFYEGYNDLFTARYYGLFTHFFLDETRGRYDATSSDLAANRLREVSLVRFAAQFGGQAATAQPLFLEPPDSLGRAAADQYLTNADFIDAAAERFGVEAHFFWQPVITVGDKPLTVDEQRIRGFTSDAVANFERVASDRIAERIEGRPNFHHLGTVFDTTDSFVWIDAVHLTETGNRLIAEAIAEALPVQAPGAGSGGR